MARRRPNRRYVGPWHSLHAALWLIGLGTLIWGTGHLWPGVLVLAALSLILEGMLTRFAPGAAGAGRTTIRVPPSSPPLVPPPAAEHRLELLPVACPKCGAPIQEAEVKWTGPQSAECIYCGANLPMEKA